MYDRSWLIWQKPWFGVVAHARFITALKVQLDAISGAWRFVGMQTCFKIGCIKASFIWSGLRRSRVC
jgi:hypothetical protein